MAKFGEMCFRKADVAGIEENLQPDSLKLFKAFNGIAPMSEIMRTVGLENSVFKSCFMELFKNKFIVEVSTPADSIECLEKSVLDLLKDSLVQIAGPVGELLVNDALELLQLDPAAIPKDRLSDLILEISNNIPGEKQKEQFIDMVQ